MCEYERLRLAAMLLRSSGGDSALLFHWEKFAVKTGLLLAFTSFRIAAVLQLDKDFFLPRDGGSGRIQFLS